ncbi:efflux transporter, RND family, MFP subunit [Gemmatirosa kalamazoonensis]|uniref:Efflux transporter, RND family, MFP subunit n=1 Tax=Gemmatirosa kalamazoonensis TaxID=861299 RepID=W0RED0_9BACT|nr:efflux RND transporter periplasmic adaptor subunit [Gemmatirosa kalamazoonensis]AHG89464.1 efflux transporter, RND family, MFP subunit [Gemmatirosa kalamazoonensis]
MPSSSPPWRRATLATVCVGVVGAVACKKPPPPPPPPPEVSVVTVTPAPVEDDVVFTGQVQASRTVQVRAQVSGVIVARTFVEGTAVHAGDALYRIDPTTSQADVRSARARLAEARARLQNATTTAERLRPLLEGNAVARQEVDNAESQVAQARAAVEEAQGIVDAAQKGLAETVVRAEIGGRVGRALLDVGTRVSGVGDVLTSIDVLDPIYVSFRPSAEEQLRWRRHPAMWRALEPNGSARVEVTLADGTALPAAGRIGFIDPVVDPATGTQEFRAQFANPARLLLPGQFARVRVRGLTRDSAIVVPQRAVLQQLGRQSVYVVGADDKVAARDVKAASWAGQGWIIEDGLKAGERVVVDGVQKVQPGAAVRPTPLADSARVATGGSR